MTTDVEIEALYQAFSKFTEAELRTQRDMCSVISKESSLFDTAQINLNVVKRVLNERGLV
jgi:hypothetical protein